MPLGPVTRPATIAACGLTALWAIAGGGLAVTNSPPAVFTAGFEFIIAAAAVVGLLHARSNRDGLSMTLACLAGAVFVGSVLGYIAAGAEIHGRSMQTWTFARVALAGLLAGIAGWTILARNPQRSLPTLALGLLLAVPVLAGAAALYTGAAGRVLAPVPGLPRLGAVFLLFVATIALISASIHLVIKAFALAGPERPTTA